MYWGLKEGILNIADYDPLGYELSCCDSLCQVFLNFIISRSQHTVNRNLIISTNILLNCLFDDAPSIFRLCLYVWALGPTPYHGCWYRHYPGVGCLAIFLLFPATFDHVPEFNYQDEGALLASVHTSRLTSAISQDCCVHRYIFIF